MTQGETRHPASAPVPAPGRLLFAVLGGAAAWTLHFMGSYALVAAGCVAGWDGTRLLLGTGTAALTLLAAASAALAWRDWRRLSGDQHWESALSEPRGWAAFLLLTGALLGAVSAFTILLEGFGTLALPLCDWTTR